MKDAFMFLLRFLPLESGIHKKKNPYQNQQFTLFLEFISFKTFIDIFIYDFV